MGYIILLRDHFFCKITHWNEKIITGNFLSNYLCKCFVGKGFGGLYYLLVFTHFYPFLPIVTLSWGNCVLWFKRLKRLLRELKGDASREYPGRCPSRVSGVMPIASTRGDAPG